jgi:hypothetical protein
VRFTEALEQLGYRLERVDVLGFRHSGPVNGPVMGTDEARAELRALLPPRNPRGRQPDMPVERRAPFLRIWDQLPLGGGLRTRLLKELRLHSSSITRWRHGR